MRRNSETFEEISKRVRRLARNPVSTPEEKAAADAELEEAFKQISKAVETTQKPELKFSKEKTKGLLAKLAKLIGSS